VAVTGVGGPGPEEGVPAGTVHLALSTASQLSSRELRIDGDPAAVVAGTVSAALECLIDALGV